MSRIDEEEVESLASALNDSSFSIWSEALRKLNRMLERYSDEIDFGDSILTILLTHEKVSNNDIIPSEDGWKNRNQESYADVFFDSLSNLKIKSMTSIKYQLLIDFMIENGLTNQSGTVRRYSWYFLAINKVKTVPNEIILLGLNDEDLNAKRNAIQYLGEVPSDSLVPNLIENLSNNQKLIQDLGVKKNETTMRVASYISLANLGTVEHLELLINIYDELEDFERFQVLPHLAKTPWPSSAKIELLKLFRKEIERGRTENLHSEFNEKYFGKSQSLYDSAKAALKAMEKKNCERCDLTATKSRDIILKNGDNISSRYDNLCDSCTELAVKARQDDWSVMLNKLKSPEWNIQPLLKRLEQARGEKDISTQIRCMSDIGIEEAKMGNLEKAIDWVSNAIELNRNLDPNKQSSMLFLLAKIESLAKNHEKADELFREAFSLERKNREKPRKAGVLSMNFSTVLRDYGRILIKQKRWEEAEKVFKEAIEVWTHVVGQNNSKSGLLMLHGTILGKLNREIEQTESFNESVRILKKENKEIPQWLIDHLGSDK